MLQSVGHSHNEGIICAWSAKVYLLLNCQHAGIIQSMPSITIIPPGSGSFRAVHSVVYSAMLICILTSGSELMNAPSLASHAILLRQLFWGYAPAWRCHCTMDNQCLSSKWLCRDCCALKFRVTAAVVPVSSHIRHGSSTCVLLRLLGWV